MIIQVSSFHLNFPHNYEILKAFGERSKKWAWEKKAVLQELQALNRIDLFGSECELLK